MGIIDWLKARRARPDWRLVINEEGVFRICSDGRSEQVLWKDLTQVLIMTSDAGPLAADFNYVFFAQGRPRCVVPLDEATAGHLLDWLNKLPGLDHEAIVRASGSVQDAQFLIWEKP